MRSEALVCHPDTPSKAVSGIDVSVSSPNSATLSLAFHLRGDLPHIRVPPRVIPRRADGLWRHTCFEVFIAKGGSPAYLEFNFAPSGEWAAYTFRGYRDGAAFEHDFDPRIAVNIGRDALQLDAFVPLEVFSIVPGEQLRLALSVVIEEDAGALTYWALQHPPGRPDFHHRDAFALLLTPA